MRKEVSCITGEESWHDDANPVSEPIPTQDQIDAEKELYANEALKGFALVALDEINLLRAQLGLPPRTVQQMKNAIKSKL